MLRGNLSTRPFYNERLVNLALGAVAIAVLLFTVFNVSQLVSLSSRRRTLNESIQRDQAEADRLRGVAAELQQTVDRSSLADLAASTREANTLIDQRTFSWTAFFGQIERTLPIDVRLVTVSPRIERGTLMVDMAVIARDLSDIDAFIDALRGTGSFHNPAPIDQQSREDGSFGATVEAIYGAAPAAAAVPAQAQGGAR